MSSFANGFIKTFASLRNRNFRIFFTAQIVSVTGTWMQSIAQMWLVLHLVYLIGFKTKITTLLSWTVTFLSTRRGQLTITDQQAFARTRLEQLAELAAEARESETARAAS